jgi:uncharacterized protein YegL
MVNLVDDIADYFADNPEPRCACVLLVDVSGSMSGSPIAELNKGLAFFKTCIEENDLAALRTEIAVITYNNTPTLVHDFTTVDMFDPPTLKANGGTVISSGIEMALDCVEERKAVYKANGITYYRPWIWLLCDGRPEHDSPAAWEMAKDRVKFAEQDNQVAFFVVGVGDNANMQQLDEIGTRQALRLDGLEFRGMFQWLSSSMASVSQSQPGDSVALNDPTGPSGWATV